MQTAAATRALVSAPAFVAGERLGAAVVVVECELLDPHADKIAKSAHVRQSRASRPMAVLPFLGLATAYPDHDDHEPT
jgi:hypothetical protein